MLLFKLFLTPAEICTMHAHTDFEGGTDVNICNARKPTCTDRHVNSKKNPWY